MLRRILTIILVMVVAGLTAGTLAPPASAHEGRRVGAYEFDVGWGIEPAYAGFTNYVHLSLHLAHTAGDAHGGEGEHAVNDLGDTLKVEVSFGDKKRTYTLEPNFELGEFGEPGSYRASLIPTRPGSYTFRFTGTVRGQRVDQTFTSGPRTFDNVQNTSEAGFPDKDPTTGELSTKLDRETGRINAALTAAVKKSKKDVDNAKLFGYAGLGLAAIATIIALARGRRKSA